MIGTKILEEKNSKINGHLTVVKDIIWGTYIKNQLTQSGGIARKIWQQTLKKYSQNTINNCLILGLGGGSIAQLVRGQWPDANVTGVDIDPVIVELGKKYLDLDSQNVKIIISDAYDFVNHQSLTINHKFDLICIDTYQGDHFPEKFESEKFLKAVKKHLSKNGIAIFNRLYYGEKRPEAFQFEKKLEKHFKVSRFFPESNIMFISSVNEK